MALLAENTRRWKTMVVKPEARRQALHFAARALVYKDKYVDLVAQIKRIYNLDIPWWFVPLVHERECTRGVDNWSCNIAQGTPFSQHSRIKPYNGPFSSWRVAAIQALVNEAPKAARNTNWSGGGTMTIGEQYNGLGYARMGKPSPYIWSGTQHYVSGKYVRDGKYSAKCVDTQLGMAVALKALMELDPTIQLDGDLPAQDKTARKSETAVGTGIFASILAFINTNPWFTFTWLDITGILVGTSILVGVIVYQIIKHKRSAVDVH